jgi:hypothetical protein
LYHAQTSLLFGPSTAFGEYLVAESTRLHCVGPRTMFVAASCLEFL